ncbi:hypothetical protein LCGC14_2574900 [marine sediment metagenome]|uniref:Uncharacterized protein n=1 Tax=marine sediment metagenome TaxID=412755 RepID=A0A0F9AGJ0_9ZZZZ
MSLDLVLARNYGDFGFELDFGAEIAYTKMTIEANAPPAVNLARPIESAFLGWTRVGKLTPVFILVFQDTDPTFHTKYKIEMGFQGGSPVIPLILIPLIPFIIKALIALGLFAVVWKVADVVENTSGATQIEKTQELLDDPNFKNLSPEERALVLGKLPDGAKPGIDLGGALTKTAIIAGIVMGGLVAFNLTKGR